MGSLTLKSLVRNIDNAVASWLSLSLPVDEEVAAWAALHGWHLQRAETQRLLVSQALFDNILLQAIPELAEYAFNVPLRKLGCVAPLSLVKDVSDFVRDATATFNPWGELYGALIAQPQRRQIGQFWTEEHIAEWMVAWLLQARPAVLVDVGCGSGNALLKAALLSDGLNASPRLWGCDISPLLLNVTLAAFLSRTEMARKFLPTLVIQNYLERPLPAGTDAVFCNPPYTRHHQIAPALKDALQASFKARFHLDVSRQGTMALFFLLKLIAEMPEGARAAFIAPMEVLDARYGLAAKLALTRETAMTAVIHFSPQMNAFHKVDVGAVILFFTKGHIRHHPVRCIDLDAFPTADMLLSALASETDSRLPFGSLIIRSQEELLEAPKWSTGVHLDQEFSDKEKGDLIVPLKSLARVVRGIATGANEFFVLPADEVRTKSLEPFVVRTVQRNREVQDIVLDEATWHKLADEGKRVWLLYLNGEDIDQHPALRAYLAHGEALGYHRRSLVQTRRRWYLMEQREVPPLFFTLLTRGNPRFILNLASVRPLNMFLLIYPKRELVQAEAVEVLWALLNSDFSRSRLHSISRTYGGNTLKVEPRELDNLPVINPLALNEDQMHKVRSWIAEALHLRQTETLLSRINNFVEDLLRAPVATPRSGLPIQMRLFESNVEYGEGSNERTT